MTPLEQFLSQCFIMKMYWINKEPWVDTNIPVVLSDINDLVNQVIAVPRLFDVGKINLKIKSVSTDGIKISMILKSKE